MAVDRLALSRAQHFQSRQQTGLSHDDDDENIDAVSDWSESDRECCPLSDVDLFSNHDGMITDRPYDDDFEDEKLPRTNTFLEQVLNLPERAVPIIPDSSNSTHVSIENDLEKMKNSSSNSRPTVTTNFSKKTSAAPLLPARRVSSKPSTTPQTYNTASILPSRSRKTTQPVSPTRPYLRRENTSTSTTQLNFVTRKDSTVSMNSSSPSHEDSHPAPTASPILSHTSTNNSLVPRVYELKKLFVDDCDYGRLTDPSVAKTIPARNRQKWGTIVHPPFPLGYQQIPPEQVNHVVERLSSPNRSRDRRTPSQTPSKRYLSVEETEALITRLTKTKPIRSSDPYYPVQRSSKPVKNFNNTLKTNQQWKSVGVSG